MRVMEAGHHNPARGVRVRCFRRLFVTVVVAAWLSPWASASASQPIRGGRYAGVVSLRDASGARYRIAFGVSDDGRAFVPAGLLAIDDSYVRTSDGFSCDVRHGPGQWELGGGVSPDDSAAGGEFGRTAGTIDASGRFS